MKLPAFESLDEKRAWEAYKEANPPKGQAQFYYKDNAEYWKSGFNSGVIERDKQWTQHVSSLEQAWQSKVSKLISTLKHTWPGSSYAIDINAFYRNALAEFYAANAANGGGK